MTTPNTVHRIASKIPVTAFASLLVDAQHRGDKDQLDSLLASLLTRPSRERRLIFIEQHAQSELSLLWGMELWQAYAQTLALLAVLASPDTPASHVDMVSFLVTANEKNVASLIEAMKQICAERGVSFDGIASMATLGGMVLDPDVTPMPSLVNDYRNTYGTTSVVKA